MFNKPPTLDLGTFHKLDTLTQGAFAHKPLSLCPRMESHYLDLVLETEKKTKKSSNYKWKFLFESSVKLMLMMMMMMSSRAI